MRVLLVVLAIAGCSKTAEVGPPCPVVVDHMVAIMKAGLKGHESVNLGDRQQMIDQCVKRKMSPKEMRCMAEAKDLGQLASCRPAKALPPGPPPNTPPAPAPIAPAPAPTEAPAQPAGSGG